MPTVIILQFSLLLLSECVQPCMNGRIQLLCQFDSGLVPLPLECLFSCILLHTGCPKNKQNANSALNLKPFKNNCAAYMFIVDSSNTDLNSLPIQALLRSVLDESTVCIDIQSRVNWLSDTANPI